MEDRYLMFLEDSGYLILNRNLLKVQSIYFAVSFTLDDLNDPPISRIISEQSYILLPIKYIQQTGTKKWFKKYKKEAYYGQYYVSVWNTEGRGYTTDDNINYIIMNVEANNIGAENSFLLTKYILVPKANAKIFNSREVRELILEDPSFGTECYKIIPVTSSGEPIILPHRSVDYKFYIKVADKYIALKNNNIQMTDDIKYASIIHKSEFDNILIRSIIDNMNYVLVPENF